MGASSPYLVFCLSRGGCCSSSLASWRHWYACADLISHLALPLPLSLLPLFSYASWDQNYIIDGSGVYITRNQNYGGSMSLKWNTAYDNGINGVVVHKTYKTGVVVEVEGNVLFNNGRTSRTLEGRQKAGGFVVNNAGATGTPPAVLLRDNVVQTEAADDMTYQCFGTCNIAAASQGNQRCTGGVSSTFPMSMFPSAGGACTFDPAAEAATIRARYPASSAPLTPQYAYFVYPTMAPTPATNAPTTAPTQATHSPTRAPTKFPTTKSPAVVGQTMEPTKAPTAKVPAADDSAPGEESTAAKAAVEEKERRKTELLYALVFVFGGVVVALVLVLLITATVLVAFCAYRKKRGNAELAMLSRRDSLGADGGGGGGKDTASAAKGAEAGSVLPGVTVGGRRVPRVGPWGSEDGDRARKGSFVHVLARKLRNSTRARSPRQRSSSPAHPLPIAVAGGPRATNVNPMAGATVVEMASAVAPASAWSEHWDANHGAKYYVHTQTGRSSWSAPSGRPVSREGI